MSETFKDRPQTSNKSGLASHSMDILEARHLFLLKDVYNGPGKSFSAQWRDLKMSWSLFLCLVFGEMKNPEIMNIASLRSLGVSTGFLLVAKSNLDRIIEVFEITETSKRRWKHV